MGLFKKNMDKVERAERELRNIESKISSDTDELSRLSTNIKNFASKFNFTAALYDVESAARLLNRIQGEIRIAKRIKEELDYTKEKETKKQK